MLRGFILPFFMCAAPAFAQEAEIVVTGQGLRPALGEEVYDTVVIGRERLTGSASNRIEDILRDVPGFQLFRRSDARSAHPTSQGVTLRALGGNASSRALLLLDGVPQTDPFGGWVNWPAYDPASLAEVRVIRGGGAVAHGSGALAGVIEMSSGMAGGVHASAEVGSRESMEGRILAGAPLAGGRFSVSGRAAR